MTATCHAAWVLAFVPACFHPTYDHPACGPNGECPSGLVCSAQQICEGVGNQLGDAGSDSIIDSPPGTQACFGTGLSQICFASAPTQPLTISGPTTIDTTTSPMCASVIAGGSYCVLAATEITIEATLRATGARPLVLVASDSITTMTSGLIDVGSHRGMTPETGAGADPAACQGDTPPVTSGGGAGGSFTGSGGAGGIGSSGTGPGGVPGAPVTTITEVRGGCGGQDGAGSSKGARGHGGGAVFLIAGNSIGVAGGINAAGEGGGAGTLTMSGAGGGGAGGLIGFDAPAITITSLILANGGGGGEGSGTNTSGIVGSDPAGVAAASGGSGGSSTGGDGGSGSAGAAAGPGAAGLNAATGGGGGGGGGAGLVKAPASAALGTQVSPLATP